MSIKNKLKEIICKGLIILSVLPGCPNMPAKQKNELNFRGINYNAGIDYNQNGGNSSIDTLEFMQDLKNIKEMNCNSVRLYGSYNEKLLKYTELARKDNMIVWVSPRYIGKDKQETLDKISELSGELQNMYNPDSLFLIIGNEFSIDMGGITQGNTYGERAKNQSGYDRKKLRSTLEEITSEVRKKFKGKITYAAMTNEDVPFELFDYIGLNYYWNLINQKNYAKRLKKLSKKYNKEVIVTEFGTCGYKGASLQGGNAYSLPPLILVISDDNEQVKYLKKCFKAFEKENVKGTFVFDYAEKWKTYSENKNENKDLGSFGVMRKHKDGKLTPKPSFYFIKNHYKK